MWREVSETGEFICFVFAESIIALAALIIGFLLGTGTR